MRPLAVDLFCGLGGWTEGLLAEGYRVVGFDVERHRYPERDMGESTGRKVQREKVDFNSTSTDSRDRSFNYANQCAMLEAPLTGRWMEYPAQLVLQDVLTIQGSQFKSAALIVASPPCQAYSYRAMPWKLAKALPPPDNSLFEACFRIQREASEAAGHHIPMVVENVCGAQKWVGRARWHYGSFYLWGDVPALMPIVRRVKKGTSNFHFFEQTGLPSPSFHGADHEPSVQRAKAIKNDGGSLFNVAHNTTSGHGQNPDGRKLVERVHYEDALKDDGIKGDDGGAERDHHNAFGWKKPRTSSHSSARKAASAHIAKIPLALARHIAKAWHP
jgi:hypothetical protein